MADLGRLLNQTDNNTLFLVTSGTCCDQWATILPLAVILGIWALFFWMTITKKDIGYAFLMLFMTPFMFANTIMEGVQFTANNITISLPLIFVLISIYEMLMTVLLLREMNNRKNSGDEGE